MHLSFILTDDDGTIYTGDVELARETKRAREDRLSTTSRNSNGKQKQALINYKFPSWFYKSKVSVPHAVALFLYETKVPYTSGQISKIISSAWKDIHLRNISKVLTTRGKWLYIYVERDNDGTYSLNDNGIKWVREEVIPLYAPKSLDSAV